MAQLPQEFLTRMQDMLGDEFDAFLTSYDAPRTAGLRVNTKKCRTEEFSSTFPDRRFPTACSGNVEENSVDSKRLFRAGRHAHGPVSAVCGRRLLSAGAKRHDPGVPPPDRTG